MDPLLTSPPNLPPPGPGAGPICDSDFSDLDDHGLPTNRRYDPHQQHRQRRRQKRRLPRFWPLPSHNRAADLFGGGGCSSQSMLHLNDLASSPPPTMATPLLSSYPSLPTSADGLGGSFQDDLDLDDRYDDLIRY